VTAEPTPRMGNVRVPWRTVVQSNSFILAWPTRVGRSYTVESRNDLSQPGWQARPPVPSTGLEMSVQDLLGARRFFRVLER